MPNLNNANIIKALLIDFILKEELIQDCLFANEIFYGTSRKITDLLAVNGYTTAFEIKSSNDDLRKLPDQLLNYQKVYDYQYVVTTKNHFKNVFSALNSNVGLILIDEKGTCVIKKAAKRFYGQSKTDILDSIPSQFLRSYFRLGNKLGNSFEIRKKLSTQNITTLRKVLRDYYKLLLASRNELFLRELGCNVHFEDLKLLSDRANRLII